MPKLSNESKNLIRLILRSNDIGDGWRALSIPLNQFFRPLIEANPDLFQYDEVIPAVRLTERGGVIAEYL
jgi:hypothetical protein